MSLDYVRTKAIQPRKLDVTDYDTPHLGGRQPSAQAATE